MSKKKPTETRKQKVIKGVTAKNRYLFNVRNKLAVKLNCRREEFLQICQAYELLKIFSL